MNCTLVTGGAGFIGSHLVDALLAAGRQVIVLDDESTGSAANLADAAGKPGYRFVSGSAGDRDLIESLLETADEVYHLAAAVGVALVAQQPIETIERNIYPTQLILAGMQRQAAAGRDVKLFLASTSEVYGKNPKSRFHEDDDLVFGPTKRPRWCYGASKAVDEFLGLAYWRQYRLPVVVGRFFNVVGPRQSGAYGMVLPRFVDAAVRGETLRVHDDGQQVRCFAHVSDVVRAVIQLLQTPAAYGRAVNIGSDEPVSILQLAERVVQAAAPTSAEIAFQSYKDAYDEDFEDIRQRVPDLNLLRELINHRPEYCLDDIIRALIAERGGTA